MSAALQSKRGRNPNIKYYDTLNWWVDAAIDLLFRITYYATVLTAITWFYY